MIAYLRRWSILLAVIVLAAFATQSFTAATGQRYRDEIFASSTKTADIAYGQAPDVYGNPVTLRLDLYQPTDDTETLRPVYIWIHGGAFVSGDKADATDAMIADRFAKRGYVTASINYRLQPMQIFEWGSDPLAAAIADTQHDAQAAVRWFRANAATYHIDPNRIAVGGYSAGAIASLYVAYNSGDPGDSGNPGYPSTVWPIVDVSGALEDTGLMDAGEPPVLIVHGTADLVVPYLFTTNIVNRANAVGIPYELHTLDGASHFVWDEGYGEQIIGWMSDWLFQYLAPPPATPTATPTVTRTATPTATRTATPTITPTPPSWPWPVGGLAEAPDASPPADGQSNTFVLVIVAAVGSGAALMAGAYYTRRRRKAS
jgi:acetyl esterase/lipase